MSRLDNQGGGEDPKQVKTSTSSDDCVSHKQNPNTNDSADLNSLNLDYLSDPSSFSSAAHGTAPVLDSAIILSGLERDKKSPSRFSVDVECESVVSDYSEVSGPLKEIERDVQYLDRDALAGELSFLELTGKYVLSESESIEKRDDETEEEFQKRLRKVNLLSLAQEFAELKKVDTQACPVSFHNVYKRRQSANSSPYHSRGQSLERPRRIPSKTQSSLASSQQQHRGSIGCDPAQTQNSMTSSGKLAAGIAANQNHIMDELPVNEARRRCSNSDLPANMRPERQGASTTASRIAAYQRSRDGSTSGRGGGGQKMQQASSQELAESDGDFDVYNIETAVPNLDWDTLKQQLELAASDEQTRLDASKNEREEIRRRLAMADDGDATTPTQDGAQGNAQSELPSSSSGMQICFVNDDTNEEEEARTPTTALSDHTDVDDESQPLLAKESSEAPSKQTQMHSEATLALAQASTMAKMQLEVEKQTKKKSPIADMVGIPTLGNGRKLRLSNSKLLEMNIAQLQVLVNDLHTQIELLNEDLVHLLIERDDLHMEQDSMLVDIEDLTR